MTSQMTKTAFACLMVLFAGTAAAEEPPAFAMERTEEGIVRLNTRTGEMVLCRPREGAMACAPAARGSDDLLARIDALEDRIAALEARRAPRERADELPSDAEIDRTMGIMEKFMRRFFSIVEDLNKDFGSAGKPVPDAPGASKT